MSTYPAVLDEFVTLQAVLAGRSLSRYGDGEFNLALGGAAKLQAPDSAMAARLRAILRDSGDCLVGIPNIRSATPKAAFWGKYLTRALPLLTDREYASAFVTRPDSAPWIDVPEYWGSLESLWQGRTVTLVCGSDRSLRAADLVGADVTEIVGPRVNAWQDYDELLDAIGTPELAVLCLGPTATVLAVDLCARGVQAVDLGHVGMFLKKHRRGEPMAMTAADHALV